jgi:DNA-binding SARP family transcriptional activator
LAVTVELTVLSRVAYRGNEITGPRLRGLLALLAGEHGGRSVSRLVDGLWPADQPENPAKALQILVSRIRAQLGDGLITRTPTGYRLALAEDQVDAWAVLRHAEAARIARAGDHARVLDHVDAALALWDGPPKPDESRDPLTELRAERAVTYRTLVRARALALARLGRHAEAVGPLTDLAAEYPRDEEVLLELIRAEAVAKGPASAMARYDAYRRTLRDELGADPGPALRTAHRPVTPMAARTASGSAATSCPPTVTVPASAVISVDRICTAVVLPAPFGPSSEKIVPAGMCRSMPSRTTCSPNCLRSPVTPMAVVPMLSSVVRVRRGKVAAASDHGGFSRSQRVSPR